MAGTTNFVQQNPTSANQQTDAQYQADSLTTGGIGEDAILPSTWLNKIYYQLTTFVAAFAQMMANKGYNMSDSNIVTLEATLAHVLTSADTKPPMLQVPFSATPTFDCSQSNGFRIDLSGNVTSSSIINFTPYQIITFYIVSTSPGNFSFAWPSNVIGGQNVQSQSSGNLLTQQFISDGTNFYPLQTFLNVLNGYINTLNGQVSTINGQISTLNGQVSTINGQISTLNSEISGIDSSITALQGQVSSLSSTVSGLSSQVSNLNSIVNPIPGEISTLQSQVSGLLAAFANSLTSNGYQKFENGLIIQWGQLNMGGGGLFTVSFPLTFPHVCLWVIAGTYGDTDRITYVYSWSNSGAEIGNNGSGVTANFLAIGY